MSECLLEGSSPPLYPALRPPMAPLWEWDGGISPCMSAWAPGIAVDGPTAWLRNTWMASSSRSSLSSIRLCCRTEKRRRRQRHSQHDRVMHVWQHWPCTLYLHFQISVNSASSCCLCLVCLCFPSFPSLLNSLKARCAFYFQISGNSTSSSWI